MNYMNNVLAYNMNYMSHVRKCDSKINLSMCKLATSSGWSTGSPISGDTFDEVKREYQW